MCLQQRRSGNKPVRAFLNAGLTQMAIQAPEQDEGRGSLKHSKRRITSWPLFL